MCEQMLCNQNCCNRFYLQHWSCLHNQLGLAVHQELLALASPSHVSLLDNQKKSQLGVYALRSLASYHVMLWPEYSNFFLFFVFCSRTASLNKPHFTSCGAPPESFAKGMSSPTQPFLSVNFMVPQNCHPNFSKICFASTMDMHQLSVHNTQPRHGMSCTFVIRQSTTSNAEFSPLYPSVPT